MIGQRQSHRLPQENKVSLVNVPDANIYSDPGQKAVPWFYDVHYIFYIAPDPTLYTSGTIYGLLESFLRGKKYRGDP